MPWLETVFPVRMTRIALVAPAEAVRQMLVAVAESGMVEIDAPTRPGNGGPGNGGPGKGGPGEGGPGKSALPAARVTLSAEPPDLTALGQAGRDDLIAGEAQLRQFAGAAVHGHGAAALAGWVPARRLGELTRRLAAMGCGVVPLPRPATADAPTLISGTQSQRALTPLVSTYGTVPYADINPAWLAWASYVLMFGMMFGDAGDGLLLIGAAMVLRAGWPRWASRYRPAWPFVAGAGVSATAFGILYGEFFGPTGVVPTLWLDPLASPVPLLLAGIGIGAVLLAVAYGLGTINRWREGGWPLALYAPSGIAGSMLFCGVAVLAAGWYYHVAALLVAGGVLAVAALALAFAGFAAEAGGGAVGSTQAAVEIFDLVVRLGSNIVSFARLAAFGLAHAALGLLVWNGTRALVHRGGLAVVAAVLLFVAGNALAFGLEALVAAVQALRLEYYELFSRVFVSQGRPFRPWHLPVERAEEGLAVHDGRQAVPSLTGAAALRTGEA
jgi:V/A-type H+/Na+-transporting ATPase subunit I